MRRLVRTVVAVSVVSLFATNVEARKYCKKHRCCSRLDVFRSQVQEHRFQPFRVTISPAANGRPANLNYELGGYHGEFPRGSIPLDEPLRLQSVIEGIRVNGCPCFWSGPISQAEACVAEALLLIDSHTGPKEDLVRRLRELSWSGMRHLVNALNAYAASQGMTITNSEPAPAPMQYPVEIKVKPKVARVYHLDKWSYDVLSDRSRRVLHNWSEIGTTLDGSIVTQLVGNYYFRIVWPAMENQIAEDHEIESALITITGPRTLTFVP